MNAETAALPLVLAQAGRGTAFLDLLDELARGDRRLRERLAAFLLQWGHLIDDLGRDPTVSEYGERWSVPISTVYRLLDEFREVFPTERDPGRLHALLWDGLSHRFGELLRVPVEVRQ